MLNKVVALPVQRNGQKICYAGCAGHDISGNPEFAEISPKAPCPSDVIDQGKWHDHSGNKEICNGHGDEEQVGELAEVTIRGDGNAYQDVTQNGKSNLNKDMEKLN